MPIHDWTRVEAGTFHDFHHSWIEEVKRALNGGLLPADYYAMAEQVAYPFGPDVLTLQGTPDDEEDEFAGAGRGLLLAEPKIAPTAESDMEFYRRKKSHVAVKHITGDRVVAIVEIVSSGNKSSQAAIQKFLEKAADLLDDGVHLLVLDLFPPGPRDPKGIHAAIWDFVTGQAYAPPVGKPLTLAAYETSVSTRAFVQAVAVGDLLPEMPLFLEVNGCVQVPLEKTYDAAFSAVPAKWRRAIQRG